MLKLKGQKPVIVPPISLSALFDLSCARNRNHPAVVENDLSFTRAEMQRDSKLLAKALLEMDAKEGDIITSASSRSTYGNLLIALAANRIGCIATFHDERVTDEYLFGYLAEFDSKIVFTFHYDEARLQNLREQNPNLRYVVNMAYSTSKRTYSDTILERFILGQTPLDKVAARHLGRLPNYTFTPDLPALITFTSGSTNPNRPKPVRFLNRNLVAGAIFCKNASDVKMWDPVQKSYMDIVNFDTAYGLTVSSLYPLCGGATLITTPEFSNKTLNYYLSKNPSVIFGYPTLLEDLPKLLKPETDLSGLRLFASGGDRLEPEISLAAKKFFDERGIPHVQVSNGYGTSEISGLISTSVGNVDYDPESVGKIPSGVSVMVLDPTDPVDDNGEEIPLSPAERPELGFDTVGYICATGEHLADGYQNRPEYTSKKFFWRDGKRWLFTGDLGFVTEDGYIKLVGRSMFFINDNPPAKVYYEVVRTAIDTSPLVKKSKVVRAPDPDPEMRFTPYAFVVTNDGVPHSDETRQEILAAATSEFPIDKDTYKLKANEVPHIVFVDDLPVTRNQKVDFKKLERMAEELAAFGEPV